MEKARFIIIAMLLFLLGCTKEADEPTELNTFDTILGHWDVTAYYSGSHYTQTNDGDYYEFNSNKTCVYYSGNLLNTYDYYQYSFLENQIACKHENGWDLGIQVDFINNNEAIFYITGKTVNSTKKVKVKRN
ncbi:MAG: hypothetical protein PHI32_05965 [Dysgonamonadaceae bacterium]|nr:hypothetical protein [Dysgonamonadaceae bacterium]